MSRPSRASCLLLLLTCTAALARGPSGAPPPSTEDAAPAAAWVAVLGFESNAEARDAAPGIAALVASRLAEVSSLRVVTAADVDVLLALERQAPSGSCTGEACEAVRERLLAAPYVVTGRLDRFGERWVLTASALEAGRPGSLARPRVEVSRAAELPVAARQVADALARDLGLPAPAANPLLRLDGAPPAPGTLSLGLRVDSTLIHSLQTFFPGADVEVGIRFHPEWVAFLQVGLRVLRVEEGARPGGGLTLVPGIAGARHLYNVAPFFQPYWGLGLGVQLSFGQFGFFQETGPLPALHVVGGLQLRALPGLLVVVEGRTNVAQAVLGLAQGGLVGRGLNLDLSAGLTVELR